MRIQDTDRVLRDARYARSAVSQQQQDEGVVSRAWRMVSSLPARVTGLFRKH
jgi:hypothetical protein